MKTKHYLIFLIVFVFYLLHFIIGFKNVYNNLLNFHIFSDYTYYYLNWINNIQLPFIYNNTNFHYMPFFLLLLKLFWFEPSILWPIFSIINFYYLNKIKKIELELYFLNPIILLYCFYSLMNPIFYTTFLTISIYYYINQKYKQSFLFLGISIMFKQFSILYFILLALNLIHKTNFKFTLKKIIYTFIPLLSFFIFIKNLNDIKNILNDGFALPVTNFTYSFNLGVILNTILYFFNLQFLTIIIFIISLIIIYLKNYKTNDIIYSILMIQFIFYIFYSRGIFKYYLIESLPFLLLRIKNKNWITLLSFIFCILNIYISFFILILIFKYLINKEENLNENKQKNIIPHIMATKCC